jgi:hypothetical protein
MDKAVVGMESTNVRLLRQAHTRLDEVAAIAFEPGFHGTVAIEIRAEDGDAMTVRRLITATDK